MATATELRSQIASLSEAATSELADLWAQILTPEVEQEREDVVNIGAPLTVWAAALAAEVLDALMDVIPALVGDYSSAAVVAAAEWYTAYRATKGVAGVFAPDLPPLGLQGAEELAGWGASLITPEDADWDAALARISGGLQRRIADAGRKTITNATYEDPQATGWQRQARPDGCGFCQMLAGRGNVFKSRDTAEFGAHDNCNCLALPAFGGIPVPVKPYTPTSRTITDADRARTRAWIKANL